MQEGSALVHGDPSCESRRALDCAAQVTGPSSKGSHHDEESGVHPAYKTKYKVRNWPAYDRALVRRGDLTLWLSPT
ncbi:MAG: hypothetical protein ACI9MC_004067, partial [Kiritimatiellia bacterium]